jgi:hypothetical protein
MQPGWNMRIEERLIGNRNGAMVVAQVVNLRFAQSGLI